MQKPENPAFPIEGTKYQGVDTRAYMATQILSGLMAKPSASSEGLDGKMKRTMGLESTEYKVAEAVRAADLLIAQLNETPSQDDGKSRSQSSWL